MFMGARNAYVPSTKYLTAKSDLDLNLIALVKSQMESLQQSKARTEDAIVDAVAAIAVDNAPTSASPTVFLAKESPPASPVKAPTSFVQPEPEPFVAPVVELEQQKEEEEEEQEEEDEEEEAENAAEDDLEDLVVGDGGGADVGDGEDLDLDEEDW